jgi:hypothetical protein
MAKIRFGYSDDFTAKNSGVGINTTDPQANLDVIGVVKGQDLKVTGISSQTGYEGVLRADHQIEENTQLNFGQGINASLSGEIIVGTGQTVTINEVAKETVAVGNGSNNEWYSLSGSYTFKANGDPTWDGSSFTYDGTGDYHQLNGSGSSSSAPESTFEVGSSNFTLEQWVYITSASSICGTFFSKGNNNSVGTEFMSLQTTGANTTPGFFFGSGSTLLSGSAVGTGGWHHYVVTRSGNNFTLYVDGTSVDTATSSSSLASGITGGINIGAQSYSVSTDGRKLNGKISITRLYSGRVLTAAEVTLNYNAGHTATTSAVAATVDLNANNPLSYPGTVNTVETTDVNVAGGSQVECMKVYDTFTPPSGGTNERPYKPKPGQLYYNYDFKTIEFFDGYGWRQVDYTSRSGRAVFAGGYAPGPSYATQSSMSYVNIASTGNALDFGSLVANARTDHGAFSSSIRGIFHQSIGTPVTGESLDYVALASGGQAVDFGNLNTARTRSSGLSSSTRGLIAGGYTHPARILKIDYVEIATVGNALEFGDLSTHGIRNAPIASPTKGVFVGGTPASATRTNEITFVTIASKGNSIDFGGRGLFSGSYSAGGVSNGVRGVYAGGDTDGGKEKSIGYLNLASTGNAQYFGDLSIAGSHHCGTSNHIRGIFNSADQVPNTAVYTNAIEYITISTAGNSIDFGDDVLNAGRRACTSDSHGGLGGF